MSSVKLAIGTILFCFVVLIGIPHAEAQNRDALPELQKNLEGPFTSDSLHADAYRQMANYHIRYSSGDEALVYLDTLESFSRETKYELGILFAHYGRAFFYFRSSRYGPAKFHLKQVLAVASQIENHGWKADALSRIATVHMILGELDSAEIALHSSQEIAHELEDEDLLTMSTLALGNLEIDRSNFLRAIEYFIEVDSIYKNSVDVNFIRRGLALQNVGNIYRDQLIDLDKALSYYQQARSSFIQSNNIAGEVASVHLDIARIHVQNQKLKTADSLFRSAILDFEQSGHNLKLAEAKMHFSDLKIKMEDPDEAEKLLLESATMYQENRHRAGTRNVFQKLAAFYASRNDPSQSISFYKKAINAEQLSSDPELRRQLAYQYNKLGQYKTALDTLFSYTRIKDTLDEVRIKSLIEETEQRYQNAQKEAEILSLEVDRANRNLRAQKMLITGIILLIMIIAVAGYFYFQARQKSRMNEQLKSIDALRSKLFADISHEFRTPLSLISGPIELLTNDHYSDQEIEQQLKIIGRNTKKLNRLVDSVNELAKLDAGKSELNVYQINIREHIRLIAASFESIASLKNLEFQLDFDIDQEIGYYDPIHLETILYNLLSNAFKYTQEGQVRLNTKTENQELNIEVLDNGPGIPDVDKKRIFERYYRGGTAQGQIEGIGIGLALASELTNLHSGRLSVQDHIEGGSKFTLTIPIGREFYNNSGYDVQKIYRPHEKASPGRREGQTQFPSILAEDHVILLVEDNPDMRKHLNLLFKDEYHIIEASEGKEGLELAQKLIPDLILSDLMMPQMDGQELLTELKKNEKTSHIPFIMLTANYEEENRLKGLNIGVDDYMLKPFSTDELKLKVHNLIRLREQLKQRYQKEGMINPERLAQNETEKNFWIRIKDVLNNQLENPDFNASDFAKAMNMSRMQLHRKLTALTSMSTTSFLRHQRLIIAGQLIRQGNRSVSDVAYSVGFSNPEYFSKSFKKLYGVSPSDFE